MKKETLFKIFSTDLKTTLDKQKLKFVGPANERLVFGDYYMCPLSYKMFHVNDTTQLSMEHVPEKSLGGKGIILTCKKVNNSDGQGKNVKILEFFKSRNFIEKSDNIEADLSAPAINGAIKGYLSCEKRNDGSMKYNYIISKRNAQQLGSDKLNDIKNSKSDISIRFKVTHEINSSALLKAAYLIAFSKLGYKLLFNNIGFKEETYGRIVQELQKERVDETFPFLYFDYLDFTMPDDIGIMRTYNADFLMVKVKYKIDDNEYLYNCVLPSLEAQSLNDLEELISKVNKVDMEFNLTNVPTEVLVK